MGRVSAHCPWRWHEGVPPDAPLNTEEAIVRIDQLYDSGKPFFTKYGIRAIHGQLQRFPGRGDQVFVRDVAGATMVYTLTTGESFKHPIWKSDDDDDDNNNNKSDDDDMFDEFLMYKVTDCSF